MVRSSEKCNLQLMMSSFEAWLNLIYVAVAKNFFTII